MANDGAEAQSMAFFDQARAAFKQGQYDQSLTLIDKALAGMPKDAEMNEFRGLALFALGRYTESAEVSLCRSFGRSRLGLANARRTLSERRYLYEAIASPRSLLPNES